MGGKRPERAAEGEEPLESGAAGVGLSAPEAASVGPMGVGVGGKEKDGLEVVLEVALTE